MTNRDRMIECASENNVDWCKPIQILGGRGIFVWHEGELAGAVLDGEIFTDCFADHKDKVENDKKIIKKICAMAGKSYADIAERDYDETEPEKNGHNLNVYDFFNSPEIHSQLDATDLPCLQCPFFDDCDVWDENEEMFDEEVPHPDEEEY